MIFYPILTGTYVSCHTISQFKQIYCPDGAANDPQGLNSYWAGGVLNYYKQLTGKDIDVYTELV